MLLGKALLMPDGYSGGNQPNNALYKINDLSVLDVGPEAIRRAKPHHTGLFYNLYVQI